ncbi:hypothetical protein AB0B12_38805 [Streptomyces sp. NPDC044780]
MIYGGIGTAYLAVLLAVVFGRTPQSNVRALGLSVQVRGFRT